MNSYYSYDGIELWDENKWQDRISSVFPLVKQIFVNSDLDSAPYPNPVDGAAGENAKKFNFYDLKTNSVNMPVVVDYWKNRGLHYECRAQGGLCWLIMAPLRCLKDFGAKLQTLVVFHREDLKDPYWAMKTLEKYRNYNEAAAESEDSIIVYIVSNVPDSNRVYVNILQEAFVFVPGDTDRVYLDMSVLIEKKISLADIEGFIVKDRNGNAAIEPDKHIEKFGSSAIPALNISGLWENRCSLGRDQISKENWSSTDFDLFRVIHSETGKKLAEGFKLEYDYDSATDPGFIRHWENMGLKYENRETELRRWKAAVPLGAFDNPSKKLPVICVMQEVNHANEHLAVTEASYFLEYFKIAASGECMLLNFVLEDPEGNELLEKIIMEAFSLYPMIDRNRIYLAGHSHNGHYALEFALRHPDVITGVATFGDPPGLLDTGITPFTEDKIERMRALDMPVIVLAGCCEPTCIFPMNRDGSKYRSGHENPPVSTFEQRVSSWQRRLRAFNCPMKSAEELEATKNSNDKAVRMIGLPGDRNEVLWMDGFENYIVDIKNNEGKYHLRIAGEENMPHNTTPNQQRLSWMFLRRFSRDPATKQIVELYQEESLCLNT
jgi:hypothetical protein